MPIQDIARIVLQRYRLNPAGIHGPAHWTRVGAIGRRLAEATPGADRLVVELFALLHDSRRLGEGRDAGHGTRAADYATAIADVLGLGARQQELLQAACRDHDRGLVSTDPTIGCCWDADRLDLARLGIHPDGRRLSTVAARNREIQAWAWLQGQRGEADPDVASAWGLSLPCHAAA